MSTARMPDDPRDPRFDAAWRGVSNEAPPARLDDAIRAAARREVGAGPAPVGGSEATRPGRWWWPLAAAATIGAIAIGILQLAPPDRALPVDSGAGIVSDMPATAAPKDARAREVDRMSDARPPSATNMPAQPQDAGATASPKKREAMGAQVELRSAPVPASPEKSDAQGASADALRDKVESVAKAKAAPEPKLAQSKEAVAEREMPAARAQVAASAPVPFPAAVPPPMAPSADARLAANAATPAVASGAAEPARRMAPAPAPRQEALGKVTASADESGVKDRAARTPAEWIAQIRKLREQGNVEAAAKELAAFRAAHPDAESLLPQDLRDWHPAPTR